MTRIRHAHLDDPGSSEWEGGAKAAAAGGITTLIDMPLNSDPSTVSPETLKLKSGEPREVLSEKGITGTHSLEDRLKTLIDSKKVMLSMKGWFTG
ncbi:hypothetical protein Bca52824_058817 [Brassica carinata]|uniref:Amidohydrolase-related domain-containing protein n=1 Tax=Brassica carinata TaxID=52824 RepID=A0A8X7QTY3_BRACI|nr:hypothetical protein Bca52824_058817 [Brassica carinata]